MSYKKNTVKACFNVAKDSKIIKIEADPKVNYDGIEEEWEATHALSEHFGWELEPYAKEKCQFKIRKSIDVSTNKKDDESHLHKIVVPATEFLLLDVGFWGDFDKKNPQRNFGVIEGRHVFLCNLEGPKATENKEQAEERIMKIQEECDKDLSDFYQPKPDKSYYKIKTLIDGIKERGYACRLLAYEFAPPYLFEIGVLPKEGNLMPKDDITIILPDMHLPERWPDIPAEEDRHPDPDARKALRRKLRAVQRTPQPVIKVRKSPSHHPSGINAYKEEQLVIQKMICLAEKGEKQLFYLNSDFLSSSILGDQSLDNSIDLDDYYVFTSSQFLAEKAIVDRKLCLLSSWFYASLPDDWEDGKSFLDDDEMEEFFALYANAAPAMDLLALLHVVSGIKQDNGSHVKVVQVGDFYELWMNREYLYLGWPEESKGASHLGLIEGTTSLLEGPDAYQYRFSGGWDVPDELKENGREDILPPVEDKSCDCYIHCEWPNEDLEIRYAVNPQERYEQIQKKFDQRYDSETDEKNRIQIKNEQKASNAKWKPKLAKLNEKAKRARSILNKRINNVKEFCLPFPFSQRSYYETQLARLKAMKRLETVRFDTMLKKLKEIEASEGRSELFWQTDKAMKPISDKKTALNKRIAYTESKIADLHDYQENKTILDYIFKDKSLGINEGSYIKSGHYLWNRLIIDMLNKLDCKMVYGNHDGYRGDKNLCTGSDAAIPWLSEGGVWYEHAHRWDQYNQDGRAYGAGVTNLVYYYWGTISTMDSIKSYFIPQFQKDFIPGAAQWFLLVNPIDKETRFDRFKTSDVKPFQVYAMGHTHTPNLVRVLIKPIR